MGIFLDLPCDNKMEFTDRRECRQVFWQAHDQMLADLNTKKDPAFRVISYYGIGGIGKSRLTEHLMDQVDSRNQSIQVSCNLKESHDQLSVLRLLSNQLRRKGVKFLLYDYARYRRSELIGDGVELMDKKTIIESSPVLSEVFDFCSCIPFVSDLTDPAKYVIDGIGRIKHLFNENRDILKRIDTMKAGELYESLPSLFAYDLNKSLHGMNKLLVIFLDTYEALVNYSNAFDDALSKDLWLRDHRYGLIPRSDRVLWVLSGRNELRWQELHRFWAEGDRLQRVALGDLSREDTLFLMEGKVESQEIKDYIYNLSNGTPLYLELCLDNYQDACRIKGSAPTPEEIGSNKASLVERYVQYRNHSERELLQILASFGIWTSDELERFKNRYYPNISDISLENVVRHSYVTKLDDGRFKIHDTVSDGVLADYAGNVQKVRKRVAEFKVKELELALRQTRDRELFVSYLEKYVRQKLVILEGQEAFEAFYMEIRNRDLAYLKQAVQYLDMANIIEIFVVEAEDQYAGTGLLSKLYEDYSARLWKAGLYQKMVPTAERALRIIEEHYYDDKLAWADRAHNYARIISDVGGEKKALIISKEVLAVREAQLGADHPQTLMARANLAVYQQMTGALEDAAKTTEMVLAMRKRVLGESHPETINSMNNLSVCYEGLGKDRRAVDLAEQVLAKRTELMGPDHPSTVAAMSNLANRYGNMGRKREALALAEQVVAKRQSLFGEDHPQTLFAKANLSVRYSHNGRLEDALALAEELLVQEQAILGEEHPSTIRTMINLSVYYYRKGRLQDSVDLSERVLDLRRQVLGQDHPDTLKAMTALARRYWKIQKKTEAYLLIKEALVRQKDLLGEKHPITRETERLLASMIRG